MSKLKQTQLMSPSSILIGQRKKKNILFSSVCAKQRQTSPSKQAEMVIAAYRFFSIQTSTFSLLKNPKMNHTYIVAYSASIYTQPSTDMRLLSCTEVTYSKTPLFPLYQQCFKKSCS